MRTMTPNELRKKTREYCQENQRSVEYLNRALGVSSGYIQKFLRGVVDMSEKRQEELANFIAKEG